MASVLKSVVDCCEQAEAYLRAGEPQKAVLFVQRGEAELAKVKAQGTESAQRASELERSLADLRARCCPPASRAVVYPTDNLVVPGTQSFLVSAEGEFQRELSSSADLRIHRTEAGVFVASCGTWTSVLAEDIPVLKAGPRFYIFTNITGDESIPPDSCIGVMLHKADAGLIAAFEHMLEDTTNFCRLHIDEEEQITEIESTRPLVETDTSASLAPGASSSWDAVVARGIERGALSMAQAFETTATIGGRVMRSAGEALRSRLVPAEEDIEVSDRTKRVVHGFGVAAHATYQGVSYVVSNVVDLAERAVHRVAPVISSYLRNDEHNSQAKQKWVHVIKAGGMGVITVLESMERAVETLANTLSEETRETVRHKYGQEAHDVARTSFNAVGNMAQAYRMTGRLRYK
ncbi:hypothetical protein PTSG_10052 [Salpingoeca rosetta]|uniref:Senescence domain-containing protein n=1 Tax=Salpingoeca rosetta (strain ATCC 50818 / BSB-021) TaxID=946362 RepID=F2UPD2_SALR5|nr:uncharacterized protein PTSG_10052 [Salpingoeca rosetta]EGD79487.1 hypothetical protein PTSG_10052 [Salpingoeca rosetta]|eukprot:XP_004988968.1 hypothetical protein PTSG_10052 [Salpingoeca rosetta]